MKRKDYQKPTTEIVETEVLSQILVGSTQGGQSTLLDYDWNDEDEE